MEWLAQLPEQLATRYRSLSTQHRIAAGLSCLVILVGIVFFAGGTSDVERVPLFDGRTFSYDELAEMGRAFQDAGLTDAKTEGNQILVPSGEKDAYLIALQSTGALPSAFDESVDQAVADSSLFRTSQETEMSYRQAEQKKLARIVASLSGIEDASVQYDEVKKPGFPPTVEVRAFVAVRAVGGRELDFEQIEAIRDTVVGYVAGLERSNVTVTDLSACRAYPGSYDRDGALGASYSYLSTKRIMESEFRQKIQRRLEVYPGAVVGVDIHLTRSNAQAPSAEANGSDSENLLSPAKVTVSVGLPKSYPDKIWRERMGASPKSEPEKGELQRIEQETETDVQRAVLAMLPPSDPGMLNPHQVTVTFYMDTLTSATGGQPAGLADAGFLTGRGPVIVFSLVVLAGGALFVGWKYWTTRIRIATPTVVAQEIAGLSPPDNEELVTSEIEGDGDEAENVHKQIARLVSQNPEAAADVIRKWLDHAA